MTWTTIILLWAITGAIAGVWNIIKSWYQHAIFEASTVYIIFDTCIQMIIGVVMGPIALAVVIWETFFDPSNI
jgi:hypothetical protein